MRKTRTVRTAMHQAAQSMQSPADLISAAVEVLVKEQCELPAFGTLERLARRIRTVVHRGIYRSIARRLTDEQATSLLRLLEADPTSGLTAFHRIKEVPKSATLTHLDEWLARLTWLQSLGAMRPLLEGVRLTKVKHLAEEAQALHATNLWDFSADKRLALLVCLIQSAQISTCDEILQMFIKRMSRITTRAKEELERVRTEERGLAEHLVEVFADYRDQLLSWEECEPKVAQYCQRLTPPMTAESFVEHLRTKLSEVAAEVDRTREANQELMINERGMQFELSRDGCLHERSLA